jgi:predicted small integral membrane protein
LGSAFICLGWLFFFGAPLWGALILCLIYAAAAFRWV